MIATESLSLYIFMCETKNIFASYLEAFYKNTENSFKIKAQECRFMQVAYQENNFF